MLKRRLIISGLIFVGCFFFAGQASASACQSNGTGNWNTAGSWTNCNSGVPGADPTDTVEILNGHTITIDTSPTVAAVTIDSGGTLTDDAGTRTLTITNSASATVWTNNGTFTATTGATGSTVKFVTTTNAAVTTIASDSTFNNLEFSSNASLVNFAIGAGKILTVNGTTTYSGVGSGKFTSSSNGGVDLKGDLTITNTLVGSCGTAGTANFTFKGTGAQLFTGTGAGGTGRLCGRIVINKSSGTLTLAGFINMMGSATDWTWTAGTVDPGSSTIVIDGTQTFNATGMSFYNLTVTVGTLTLGSAIDINGDLTITSTLTTSASNFNVNVAGNWTNNGTYTSGTNTTTFDGSGNSTIITGGTGTTQDFQNFTVAKTGSGVAQLSTNGLDVDGTLTVSSGTLDLNYLPLSTVTTCSVTGTLKLTGNESVSCTPTFNATSIAEYNATSTSPTIANWTYKNLKINGSGGTFTLPGNISLGEGLTVAAGTLSQGSNTLTATNLATISGGIYSAGSVTSTFNGGLTISGGTFTGSTGALDVNGALTLSSGTLTAPSGTFTVSGNWAQGGSPTFTPGTNTVTLDGSSQTISGSTSFYNLTKSVSSADTLTFTAGTTQTITHTLTLNGASGQLLSLRSSASPTQWSIDPQGTRTLSYLDVKDSNNVNSTAITTATFNITDSGHNTNWTFTTAPTVTTQSASSVTATGATLNGNITATGGAGPTVRGFAWGTSSSLSGGDTATTTDTAGQPFSTGAFTGSLTGLTCNTTYYSRAYATNSAGDGLGAISSSFTTSACKPTVTTSSASSVGVTTATLNGNITATGGAGPTVRGFAWGTNPNLSGGDTATTTDTAGQPFSTGAFTGSLTGLSAHTTYYSRAYATNSAGDGLGVISSSFTTTNTTPTVSSLGPTGYVDGSYTNDSTPTLTFTTADADSDNVRYVIQIDNNSDFSSLTDVSTSTYHSGTTESYTASTLPDASYYWRVLVGDGNATSSYSTAHSGSVAFIVDTTVPTTAAPTFSSLTATGLIASESASDAGSGLASSPYQFHNTTRATYSGQQAGSTWAESGLTPNTSYTYEVGVADAVGNVATSSTAATTTKANIPTTLVLTPSHNAISASWQANSNPGTTEYYAENTTAGTNSGWITATTWNSTSLSVGVTYTIQVKARNSAGVVTSVVSDSAATTNTTPTVSSLGPTGYVDGSYTNDSTPTLTFTTADADSDNVAYELVLSTHANYSSPVIDYLTNYGSAGAVSTTTGVLADGSYYWEVRVGDGQATSSYSTANAGVAFIVDTTAPTVSLTAPSNGATVAGSVVSLTASAADTGGSGVAGVQFKRATNTNIGAEDTTSTYGVSWDSTAVSDGSQTLIAVARDNVGNYATSTAATVTVDNTAPVISSTAPAASATASSTKVSYTLSETVTSGTITWTRTSGTADGSSPHVQALTGSELASGTHTNITLTNNPTLVSGAVYTVKFDGTDAASNVASSVSNTGITFDTTAPTITNINSDKADGTYGVGAVIDLDVTFSEAVTSTSNVTVTLDTGGTCSFIVSNATTGTCDYTVGSGESSADLTVNNIVGTISDAGGNALSNFTPTTNLAVNKAIVIDTTAVTPPASSGGSSSGGGSYSIFTPPIPPVGGFKVIINNGLPTTAQSLVRLDLTGGPNTSRMTIANRADFQDGVTYNYQPAIGWNLCSSANCTPALYTVFVRFATALGAASSPVSDTIIYWPVTAGVRPPPETLPPASLVTLPPPTFLQSIPEAIGNLVPGFLKPVAEPLPAPAVPLADLVPKTAPLALNGQWDLFGQAEINRFVFAPLPGSVALLASRFPGFGQTLNQVGVTRLSDLDKLNQAKLTLPGLAQTLGLNPVELSPGKFAAPTGVPLANLPAELQKKFPENTVFARGAGGLVDFNIALSLNQQGEVEQQINTVAGQTMHLEVKPDAPVKNIDGFLVLKGNPSVAQRPAVPLGSLVASPFFAQPKFAQAVTAPTQIERKLVLQQFAYTDPDGDGIYTAEVPSPQVAGEYEVITVMNYTSVRLGSKEIRLTTVVDPEGYIYESMAGKELRIPGAVASIYWLNPTTQKYELWPAKAFQQTNPQVTDVRGTYSFLVPPGNYYISVTAPGYNDYEGKAFSVEAGNSGIHTNIQLQANNSWLRLINWQSGLLGLVILLLLYNFYRDKIRDIKETKLHK